MATLLVGDNTDYAPYEGMTADYAYFAEIGHVAVATGQVTAAYVKFQSGSGNFKVEIYDSGRNLLGTSNSGTVGAGWQMVTFTSGPMITSGNTYYLAFIKDSSGGYFHCGGTSIPEHVMYDNGGSYASPPDPLATGASVNIYDYISLYAEGTAGGPTPISIADSGSGSDALGVTGLIPVADSGSGSEALVADGEIPLGDGGVGADGILISADSPLADAGSGSDGLEISAGEPMVDAGSGADSLGIEASIPLEDLGTGLDAMDVFHLLENPSLADTGHGVDAMSVDKGASADLDPFISILRRRRRQ